MSKTPANLKYTKSHEWIKTLPDGSPAEVREEAERLISLGSEGGYILSPAHGVPGDVPLENMLAFIDVAQAQPGYRARSG